MPTSSRFATISTSTAADDPSSRAVEGTFYRLIPSRFPPQDLYARIAQGRAAEWTEIEADTNPRLRAQERILGSRIDGPAPDRFQNWNHAPFAYGSAREGTRFWPPGVPALELVADIRTALAVAVARRERFMSFTDEPATELDMRVLSHPVKGVFADATHLDRHASEEERRALGRKVLELDVDGLRFHPVERPAGEGVAVLSTRPLGRSAQATHFRFLWDGLRIAGIYSFDTGETIPPGEMDAVPESKIWRC